MHRFLLVGALALVSSPFSLTPSTAAMRIYHKHVKSGVPTRVHISYNCFRHYSNLVNRGFFVDHGKVEVRTGTGNHCGNLNEPIWEIWFTSDPGYVGPAEINFPRPTIVGNMGRVIEIDVN